MTNVGAVTARYEADASKWEAEANRARDALGRFTKQTRDTNAALQRTTSSTNRQSAALTNQSKASEALAGKLKSMVGGFLALETARRAFNLAQTAAQTEDARRVFENMGGSLSKMRSLTRGLIDDATLVKKSNLANVMGIAADDFGKLANIALAAAKATGQSAEFMFDSIVTGTARQSKLILDNLGIMVSVEEANDRYAASLGLVASQLTDVQKKQAFTNEVIRKGEPLLERAAALGETNSDAFSKMSTSVNNAKDALGRGLMPMMVATAKEAKRLADAIAGSGGVVAALGQMIRTSWLGQLIGAQDRHDAKREQLLSALRADRPTITLPTQTFTSNALDAPNFIERFGTGVVPPTSSAAPPSTQAPQPASVTVTRITTEERYASQGELDSLSRAIGFLADELETIELKDPATTPHVDTAAITANALSSFSSSFAMDIGGGLLDFARQQTDIIRQGISDVVETVMSLAGGGFNETFDILAKSASVLLAIGLLFAPITVPLTVFTAGLTLAVIPLMALAATVFALTTKSQAWAETQQRMDDLFGELILALEPFAEALLLNTGMAEFFFESLKMLSLVLIATAVTLGPLFGATSEQVEAMRSSARKIRDMSFEEGRSREDIGAAAEARRRFMEGLRDGATELGKLANVGRELTNLPSGYRIAGAEFAASRGTAAPGMASTGLVVNIQEYHANNTPPNEERKLQNLARRGRSHDRNSSPYSNPGRSN